MFSATARRTQLESWTERMVLNRGCTWNPQGTGGTYANTKSHTPQFNQNFQRGAGTLVVVFCCVHSAPQVTKCSQAVNRWRRQVQVFDCSHHLVNSQQRPRGNPESTGSSFRRLTGKAKGCRSSCHATKRKEEPLRYPIETYALHDINERKLSHCNCYNRNICFPQYFPPKGFLFSFPNVHFFQPSLYLHFAPLFTLKAAFTCISQKCCFSGYFWLS